MVEVKLTMINVRNPALWRLLERSQPIIAPSKSETASLKKIEYKLSETDHSPRKCAIGSFIILLFSPYGLF